MGYSWGKLDLSDETIGGVGQMELPLILCATVVRSAHARREKISDRHRYSPRKQSCVASLENRSC